MEEMILWDREFRVELMLSTQKTKQANRLSPSEKTRLEKNI